MGNTLHNFPRFVGGASVSANIGTYDVVQCDTSNGNADADPYKGERCPGGIDNDKTSKAFEDAAEPSDASSASDNPGTYAGGVVMYPVLAVVAAILSVLFLPIFCFTRYCCCCAKGCSTCGKKYPSRFCCCCRTFCSFNDPDEDAPEGSRTSRAHYSKCQRIFAFIWMTAFVVSTIVVASLGLVNGFGTVPDSVVAMSEAPRGMASAGRLALRPMSRFLISASADSLIGTLSGLRTALLDTIDLRQLESDLRCTTFIVTDAIDTDELAALVNEIDAAVQLLPNTSTTRTELVNLNDTVTRLPVITQAMDGHIVALNTSINGILAVDIKTPLINLNASVETIRPFPGKTLSTFATVNQYLPTADDIAGPTTSLSTRLSYLASGFAGSQLNASGGLPFRTELENDLTGIANNFTLLPDLAVFASDLEAFNTTLNGLTDNVNTIEPLVVQMQDAINAMPNFDSMIATTRDMQSLVEGLSLGGIKAAIIAMNTAIKALPSLSRFGPQFTKIRNIPGQLGCVFDLVDAIVKVNTTLAEFEGDSINTVVNSVNDINSTLGDATAQIDKLETNIDDFNNTLNSLPDLDQYITDIGSLEQDVNTTQSSVNFTALIVNIESVKSSTNVSFASLLTSIRDLQTTLADPNTRPTTSMTSNLRSLNETTASLPPALRSAATLVDGFGNGLCEGAPTESCVCADEVACLTGSPKKGPAKTGQCASGTGQCNMIAAARVRVCRPTTGAETTLTPCSTNDECTPSVCVLLDFSQVSTELSTAAANVRSKPDTSSLTTQLESVQSNLNSLPPIGDKIGEVDSFTESARDLKEKQDLNQIRADIKSVQASTDSIPNVGSFISDWDGIADTLDKFDFGDVKKQLSDLNKTRDDIPTSTLNDLLDTVNKTVKFIYDDFGAHITSMGRPNLQRVIFGSETATTAPIDNINLAGGLEVILGVFEDIFTTFELSKSALDTARDDIIPRVRVMQSGEILDKGALYYFVNLLEGPTVASDKGSSVFVDMDGKKYTEADRINNNGSSSYDFAKDMCITKECIQKFADDAWTQPLATTISEPPIEGSGPSGTDAASLSITVILLYIPFFVFALVGICACTIGVKCRNCNPAICIVVGGCACLPWMLLINGALLLPPVMFAADMCASFEDLGQQYIVADESNICADLGGVGDSYTFDAATGGCNIVISNGSVSTPRVDFTVNSLDLFKDTFGGCGLTAAGNSPWASMYAGMGVGLAAWPENLVDDELLDSGPVKLKPKLKDPITNGTKALGPSITSFFSDAGEDLGCATVSDAVYGFKDAICCNVVGSFSWMAFSFWLCTWILFCCGPCAAMYGRKRFPNRLWGPEVEMAEGLDDGASHEER